MTVKSSISLTDQQAAFVRTLVHEGRYPSASAVVQQGLNLLHQRTAADEAETNALRILLERRSNGPFISNDEMKERNEAMLKRKRRGLGLDD